MNYLEEWTVIINKSKYVLNDKQSKLLKEEIAKGNRGTILFENFSIPISFIEEFYLSDKYPDKSNMIASENKYVVSEEEKRIVENKMENFKKGFFGNHLVPKSRMSLQDLNTRRNKLLDQGEKVEKEAK